MGLGSFDVLGVAEAREAARLARESILKGLDPIKERREAKRARAKAAATALTFRQAAEAYIASKSDGWKGPKHAKQWASALTAYAYPLIGGLPIAEVDNGAVLRVLQQDVAVDGGIERLWTARPETASKLRARMHAVLGWATAGGHRTGDNPAAWTLLKHQLPAKSSVPRGKVKHHRRLEIDEMPAFMQRLRACEGMGALALEFVILTAARSGEVREATWAEVDLEAKIWTVPAARMKSGREHRVPLSQAAIDVLQKVPRMGGSDLLFTAPRGGALSDMTLSAVTKRMKVDAVPHGFRSVFRDFAAERTNAPREVAEAALAHVVGDRTEAAYARSDLFERRRRLMTAWAKFLAAPKVEQSEGAEVIALKAHR